MEEVRTKRSTKGMWIAISIVLATLLACAVVGLFVNTNRMNSYGSSLEQVYQRTYYDFEEDVNNVEVKMGKLMAASSGSYQKKLIKEIQNVSKNIIHHKQYEDEFKKYQYIEDDNDENGPFFMYNENR